MAAIDVYFNKDTGSDANDGLTPATPKLTPAAFFALGTGLGYRFNLQTDMILTVNITLPAFSLTIQSDTNGVNKTISGSFSITGAGSGGVYKVKNITSKNFSGGGGATSFFTMGTSTYWTFERCEVDGAGFSSCNLPTATNRQVVYKNCTFRNMYRACTANNGSTFFNCVFKDFQNTASAGIVLNNSTGQFTGCEFINCPTIVFTNSATNYISAIFNYCTFYLKDGRGVGNRGKLISYTNAANLDDTNMSLNNCIFSNMDFIENLAAGSAQINGSLIFNNFIHSGTVGLTGYTSFDGDVVDTDPEFYDETTFDFRLEATSPAAKENNLLADNMGSNELAHPSNFFTSIVEAKVENGYAYKQLSRTNNKTGALTGYPLLLTTDVAIGVDRGDGATGTFDGSGRYTDPDLSKILSSYSFKYNTTGANNRTGTLSINAVLIASGGNYEEVVEANVRTGITYGSSGSKTGTAAIPVAADVRFGTAIDNTTGTARIPVASDVRFGTNTDNTTGSLRVPNPIYVLSGQLTDNTTGTLVGVIPANVRDGLVYGPGGTSLTGSLKVPSPANVRNGTQTDATTGSLIVPIAADVRIGVNVDATIGTLDVFAEADLPAEADVRFGVNFGDSQTGALDVAEEANLPFAINVKTGTPNYGPNLDIVPAFSPDFPSVTNVRETDTVDGIPGTLDNDAILTTSSGNYVAPSDAIVKKDESFGVAQTGLYEAAADYPPEDKVLDGVEFGTYTGSLGRINGNDMNISVQIKNNIQSFIAQYLNGWSEFEYLNNIKLNNFKTNVKRYGVIIGELTNGDEVYGQETITREYKVRLMTRFINKGQNDRGMEVAREELITKIEELRRRGWETNWGNFSSVMNTQDDNEFEIEFDEEDSFAWVDLRFEVIYSVDRV